MRVLRKSTKSHSRVRPHLVRTLHKRSTRLVAQQKPAEESGLRGEVIFVSRPSSIPPKISNLKEAATGRTVQTPRIRCPLCGWSPRKGDLWFCTCDYEWNSFDTAACAQPACISGLKPSASRAVDGRCIRSGMRLFEVLALHRSSSLSSTHTALCFHGSALDSYNPQEGRHEHSAFYGRSERVLCRSV